jgi:hypothetical protein
VSECVCGCADVCARACVCACIFMRSCKSLECVCFVRAFTRALACALALATGAPSVYVSATALVRLGGPSPNGLGPIADVRGPGKRHLAEEDVGRIGGNLREHGFCVSLVGVRIW